MGLNVIGFSRADISVGTLAEKEVNLNPVEESV